MPVPKDPERYRLMIEKHRAFHAGKIFITNGTETKLFSENTEIPEGWWRGAKKGYQHKKKRTYSNFDAYREQQSINLTQLWTDPNYRNKQLVAHEGLPSNRKGKPGILLSDEAKESISRKVTKIKLEWWKMRKNLDTRYDFRYKEWQKATFERDNYICRVCGKKELKGRQLHAHHIKSWEGYVDLRYELSNGLTCCGSCHRKLEAQEERIAITKIVHQLASDVQDLADIYGISDNPDEEIISNAMSSIEELSRVLKVDYLFKRVQQDIVAKVISNREKIFNEEIRDVS